MCLATSCRADSRTRGPAGQLWHWLSVSPFRLLSSAGLIHGLVLALTLYFGLFEAGSLHWLAFLLIYGITPLPLLGYLMTELPRWFRQSPLHHVRYFSCFVIGFSALGVLEYGLLTQHQPWLLWGNLQLVLGHLIAMRGIWWIYKWVDLDRHSGLRYLMGYLLVGLAGSLLFFVGGWLEDPLWMEISLLSGFVSLWICSISSIWLLRNRLHVKAHA